MSINTLALSKIALIKSTTGQNLHEYIKMVNNFPILSEEQEKFLINDFFTNGNKSSGHAVLNSHLRLVVKIALSYKKHQAQLLDMISEGNIGLLKALKNFSTEKEVRFATYAMLWIKASIQSFLLKSFSSVKIGTTNTQKKIIFGLNKVKKYLGIEKVETEQELKKIANVLNVSCEDITTTEKMLYNTKELSLNDFVSEEERAERGDLLSYTQSTHDIEKRELENKAILKDNNNLLKEKISNAFKTLTEREAEIVKQRILNDNGTTLSFLAKKFNVSIERVRQIQAQSLKKLKVHLEKDVDLMKFLG
jgi:RNA polymerase sigma-32 factor